MRRRLYILWFAIFSCLALVASGCGKEAKPKIIREGNQTTYDYSRKSERVASELTDALLRNGVIDEATVGTGRRDTVMRLSSQEGVRLRWTRTSYEAPESFASFASLSQAVKRAARETNARLIEETANGDCDSGSCAVFRLGFSDRSLKGLAMYLETVQVIIPRGQVSSPNRAQTGVDPVDSCEAQPGAATDSSLGDQLDDAETALAAGPTEPCPSNNAVQPYISKEPPLSSSERRIVNGGRPRLAIIIDDLGSGVAATDDLMKVEAPITVAIIPQGRYAAQEAQTASERGFAVLLHQPMEPLDPSKRPGKGGILVGMSEEEIRQTIYSNLALVPNVVGVNNHMGSRITEDPVLVRMVLDEVFAQGLFFFDSRTSSNSVVARVGREMGVTILENARFLDHMNTEEYVMDSIRIVARLAIGRGSAAAIGHVRPATVRAIQKMLPELDAAGVELVTLDKLAPLPKPVESPEPDDLRPEEVEATAAEPEIESPAESHQSGSADSVMPGAEPECVPEPQLELEPESDESALETYVDEAVEGSGMQQ